MAGGRAQEGQLHAGLAVTVDAMLDLLGRAAGGQALDPRSRDGAGETLGLLIALGGTAAAPFIYTLF